MLCELSAIGWQPLSEAQIEMLQQENKYKFKQRANARKNKATFEHYFYELKDGLTMEYSSVYKLIDSMRARLLKEGDTSHSKKDIIYGIIKYYEYLTESFTIEQKRRY